MAATIHATAVVDPSATLGEGTVVWSHACIGQNARLGANCKVGHAAYIDRDITIGDRVWIHNKASIYRPVSIGSDVFIGPHVVFVNDPDPTPHSTRDLSRASWHVSDGCTVGANATILSDVDLAPFSFIGAGSVVTRPTTAFGVYAGNPARLIGFRCACRARFPKDPGLPMECTTCKRRF